MLKLFWKSLLISPAILGALLAVTSAANAQEANQTETNLVEPTSFELAQIQSEPSNNETELLDQLEQYGNEGTTNPQGQVTSVNQLRDVDPTAWAYEALRSLVERYGCIVGYPDRTFRGDRALTRWEFAAGLNACLNVMERLIQEGVAVAQEDLETLKRLMQEFEAELAALGARVDNLEARVSFLEDNQFSTTTKLTGEVIFAITDTFGDNRGSSQTVFQDRVRLSFNTSFTGQDRLVTRLSAGNALPFSSDYRTTSVDKNGKPITVEFDNLQSPTLFQTFNFSPTTDNSVNIDWLAYYTPIKLGDNLTLNTYVAAWGGLWYDFVPTVNPYFDDYDGGNGALTTFASRNPIYQIGGGSGLGLSLQLGFLEDVLGPTSLSIGYLAPNANDPSDGNGLFNGDYSALAQLNFNLGNAINIGLTYSHSYLSADTPIFGAGLGFNDNQGTVGTSLANLSQSQLQTAFNNGTIDFDNNAADYVNNVGLIDGIQPFDFRQKVVNSYGVEMAWNLAEWLKFSAFGSYSQVTLLGRGDGEIWTYGAGFAFPDLGKEGNLLGIFAGAQPYIGNLDFDEVGVFRTTTNPIHVEVFYKYQVTDNISLTPGVIWINKPEQFKQAKDEFIGTLRGTFTF
jgi:hypothetical protein